MFAGKENETPCKIFDLKVLQIYQTNYNLVSKLTIDNACGKVA